MKTRIRLTKNTLIILLVLSALLGACIAFITYQYEIIVRGILGLAVICLIILYGAASTLTGSIDKLLLQPRLRHFILAFTWSGLTYWATRQIMETIFFILRR